MILQPYYLTCLAHASYLLGDEESGVAIVVDPQRDIDGYVADAEKRGLRIEHVVLTHFHADFVAGHLELAARTGARIHLGARAKAEYDFEPWREGSELVLGPRLKLNVLETPGHTPEGISILVFDRQKSETEPHAVLTGDTLFIGAVGRPDLMASVGTSADELAGELYDSLHEKLEKLPDATLVYPAHGAGSMCGKNLSNERVSTIGVQKRANDALRAMSKDEFVRSVTQDLPRVPDYFAFDADLNRRARPTLEQSLARALKAVTLDELLHAAQAGAQVLDTRDPDEFAAGHLEGSINIGLGGKYATWAGTLLSRTQPILLITAIGQERQAAMRLGRIGFDHVQAYLQDGARALQARPELVRTFKRWTADELAAALETEHAPLVLDVRQPGERSEKRIAGSWFVPLDELGARIQEIPSAGRIVVHCAGGYRSAIAASLLAAGGRHCIDDLIGGIAAWEAAGQPLETGAKAVS